MLETLTAAVAAFPPTCEQERVEKEIILNFIKENRHNVLTRENPVAHLSGSGMVFNKERTKILMCYHNIYNSWSWTGGHADGDADLLAVAIREAVEETGTAGVKPLTPHIAGLDILPVPAHIKRGKYVAPHLHLSVAYLLEADEAAPLTVCEGENSKVAWLPLENWKAQVREEEMHPVYEKLIAAMEKLPKQQD